MAHNTKPWLRRKGESAKAYAAAKIYFDLRETRSIEAVTHFCKKSKTLLARWSIKFHWRRRARAYDSWVYKIEQDQAEIIAKQDAKQRAQRERELREKKYVLAEQLLAAADAMVKFPLTETTQVVQVDKAGRATHVQVIKPVRWTSSDIPKFLIAGHQLCREAIRDYYASRNQVHLNDNYDDDVIYKPTLKRPRK